MPGLPAYYTAKEIADSLKMSEDFIYRHALLFGGQKFGYSWRFPPDAIRRYLNATTKIQNKIGSSLEIRQDHQQRQKMDPMRLPHGEASRRSRSKVRHRDPGGAECDPLGFRAYVLRNGKAVNGAKG